MKKVFYILTIFFVAVGSNGQTQKGNNEIIIVDVKRTYSPKKELIIQDFMDVEYVKLKTNDVFVNQGNVMDIGKEIIIVTNRIDDGDIFIYDRQGNAIRKINRKGQGGEEYTRISSITLDEDNEEMFINDRNIRRIYVYDLYGKFKRKFEHNGNSKYNYFTSIFNFDKSNLITYNDNDKVTPFNLISKQDGQITKVIHIPFKEKKYLRQIKKDPGPFTTLPNGLVAGAPGSLVGPTNATFPIIPYKGKWILIEYSSDTIYTFIPDFNLQPVISRKPSVQYMNPEVMLILRLISDRFYFMDTIINEYDWNASTGFRRYGFVYDNHNKTFSEYLLYNGDYSTKKQIPIARFKLVNHEIELWQPIEPFELVEDYKKGILKGKLKEIAATLDPEDNPVIMLIKHKK